MLDEVRQSQINELAQEKLQAPIVEYHNLHKTYGRSFELHISHWQVNRGDFIAVLGPNGAGKSTLMGLLAGLIRPDRKHFFTDLTIIPDSVLVCYLASPPSLPDDLTVMEFLQLLATIKLTKVSLQLRRDAIDKVIADFSLANVQKRLLSVLSRGFRQRVALAGTFLGTADLYLLDEPTEALDSEHVARFRNRLAELKFRSPQPGIVLSTHHDSAILDLCTEIRPIYNGKLSQGGRPCA